LTLLASSFQWDHGALVKDVRTVALAHIREGAHVLAHGAAEAWEPGDDICPPWPWWRRGSISFKPQPDPWRGKPEPDPWRDLSASERVRAAGLIDALGLLQAYNVAAKIGDASARSVATKALGKALGESAEALGKALGGPSNKP
jgi:hypothetical protein